MGWRFVYCPDCGLHQEKVGGAKESFVCPDCQCEWVEDGKSKKAKKAKKGEKG